MALPQTMVSIWRVRWTGSSCMS